MLEMEKWKIQLAFVTFIGLVQTCQGIFCDAEGEKVLSKDWQQNESQETDQIDKISSLMKRSKALRFYGLMGKRSGPKKPFQVNRRNKGDMFVGLMGRSIASSESLTKTIPTATIIARDIAEKPNDQGSQNQWTQILY